MASRSLALSVASGIVIVPVAIVLAVFVSLAFVVLFAAPPFLYFLEELRLRDLASKRREGVEKALPFFSILVNVMGGAGLSLYSIFESLIPADLFEPVRREALMVKRDVTIFGMDPNQAFERLAASHPSTRFGSFLYGYTSKVRSGGDMVAYLTGESASMVRELEEKWARYSTRAGIVGSLMVTVFGILPLLLLVVGVFSPNASVVGLIAFTGVAVPLFTVLLVLMAGRMQPAGDVQPRGNLVRSLAMASPSLLVGYFVGEAWIGASLGLSTFFIFFGLSVRGQLVEGKEIEESLPAFMKDVLEYKRQEYNMSKAIVVISSGNRYADSFDRLLGRVAGQLRAGTPLDEVKVDTSCGMAKMVFFLLGEMARTGGGTVDTVYQLAVHTERLSEMKDNTRAEMRPYLVLSYVSPLMLAFGVTFVRGVLSSFGTSFTLGQSSASLPALQVGVLPPALSQVSDLLVVVSAAALGVIGAKMTDFTVRNTFRASLNVMISMGAMGALSFPGVQALLHMTH